MTSQLSKYYRYGLIFLLVQILSSCALYQTRNEVAFTKDSFLIFGEVVSKDSETVT